MVHHLTEVIWVKIGVNLYSFFFFSNKSLIVNFFFIIENGDIYALVFPE